MATVRLSKEFVSGLVSQQRIIGEGSCGQVSLIPWHEGGTAVLKLMKESCPLAVFNREAFFQKTLNGIGGAPRLLAICEEPRVTVTSYEGPDTLWHILRQYHLPDWYVGLIGLQVGRRLGEIHANGVVHNDIHEGNVLVTIPSDLRYLPQVKIIDFGLAGLHNEGLDQLSKVECQKMYRILGQCVSDPKTDVKALGMMMAKIFSKMGEIPTGIWRVIQTMCSGDATQQSSLDQAMESLQRVLELEILPYPANWTSSTWCCPLPPGKTSSPPPLPMPSSHYCNYSCRDQLPPPLPSPRYPPSPPLPAAL